MTKVNRNNGNETKSDISPSDLFKSDTYFLWLSKSKFLIFMTKVNLNNRNETKSDIILIGKMLKYFNDLYNCHFSIPLQKWAQSSKVK